MTIWDERVDASGIRERLRIVRATIDADGTSDQLELDYLLRIGHVVERVEWLVDNLDPALFSAGALNGLVNYLASLEDHLQGWRAGNGVDWLTVHSTNITDELLNALGTIPGPSSSAEVSLEIGTLRRSVGQYRAQVDRAGAELTEKVGEVVADLESRRDTATNALEASVQAATSDVAAMRDEVDRLRVEMTELLGSARAVETNQQAVFGQTQTSNQEAFASLLAESRLTLNNELAETRGAAETEVQEFVDSVMRSHTSAAEKTAQIEELFGIAADTTLIGEYTRNAERERKAADNWRRGAVVSAGFAILIGIVALVVAAGEGEAEWDLFAAKALLAAGVAAVAAYAASQSAEHRGTQREAEHVAVQLAALKPFLKDINDETERDLVLIDIAKRLFGQSRVGHADGDTAKVMSDPSLLAAALAVIQAATKK